MIEELRGVLGVPPVPQGSWERDACFVSTAALRGTTAALRGTTAALSGTTAALRGKSAALGETAEAPAEVAERLAARLRAVPGVRRVDVRPNGFLVIVVATPGRIVEDVLASSQRQRAAPVAVPRTGEASAALAQPGAVPPRPGAVAAPWPDFPRTWDNPGFAVRYAYVRAGAVRRWAGALGVRTGVAARPELLDGPFDRAVLRVLAELPSRRESRDPGWAAYLERLAEVYHTAVERACPIPMGDEPPSEVHTARVRMGEAVRLVLGEGLVELGVAPPGKI
ncbi:DALR anticodon-binding domain-containing protein [Microbispora hainanensis]|nr:DALR anticodon-binding domain-containing protein [Microbispora hainanensis]